MLAQPDQTLYGLDLSDEQRTSLYNACSAVPIGDLLHLLDLVAKRRNEVPKSPIPSLPLEILIVGWCGVLPTHETKGNAHPTEDRSFLDGQDPHKGSSPHLPSHQDSNPAPDNTSATPVADTTSLSVDSLQVVWPTFLEKLEAISTSLVFILKNATIVSAKGEHITLSVPYTFHQDKLQDTETARQIMDTLSDILHIDVTIDIVIAESKDMAPSKNTSDEAEKVAELLGGTVI